MVESPRSIGIQNDRCQAWNATLVEASVQYNCYVLKKPPGIDSLKENG